MTKKAVTLFIIDDDDVDMDAIKRTLKAIHITNPTIRAKDGVEALAMLRGEDGHHAIEGPVIILLDLNMPRMNGHEFLKELNASAEFAGTPVFVMTTSDTDDDIIGAYQQSVQGYIIKSDMKDSLREAFEDFESRITIVMPVED